MNPELPYPPSIKRDEEQHVKDVLAEVKGDGRSRALLLIGDGGVGKTSLIRRMGETNEDPATDWVEPVDVDDPHYWLLSNLESKVTESLEHASAYFQRYHDELSQLPDYTRENISWETVVAYLGRVKETFASCYNQYVETEKKTVVIAFDTIETIRDTNLRSTLTQWMKALPKSTLFILSGRPFAGEDPIVAELENPYQPIPVTEVELGRFELAASDRYIEKSSVSGGLVNQEKDKLVYLTRGQPLWLAFVVDYLTGNDIPEETDYSLEYMTEHIPYDGELTPEGERLYQSFLRRLLAPYKESDFWHEAIKRLAVVRQPIDQSVWEMLMADLTLPEGTSLAQAWNELTAMPWIRPRGNGKYVTLHDAVAEAFAHRIFPLHDPDQEWRHRIWRRALDIYTSLGEQKEEELRSVLPVVEREIAGGASVEDDKIIGRSLAVDTLKRERDGLRASRLYYLFLVNYEQGCDLLLHYFEQANQEHDLFIQDLLVLYLLRFFPDNAPSSAFDDVIRPKLDDFRRWLANDRPDYYVAIGTRVAAYFIGVARAESALELLDRLPWQIEPEFQYRINILRGNACMRIPARVTDGIVHFESALVVANGLDPEDRHRLVAEAHKERGFYYRNTGDWAAADAAYRSAQDALATATRQALLPADLGEIASIQSNWAYVKGLAGNYTEGIQFARRATRLRRSLGSSAQEGLSWSVCGEVYRYARRFDKAWEAYAAAESLLHERPNWTWLGLIYQEQAICLYQALQDDISLTKDPMAEAKRLITSALDICLTHSIRAYPSALNRAGRIFGHDNPSQGLRYLKQGIEQARRLSDGWFLLANLVEYAELSYRAWLQDGHQQYLSQITEQTPDITQALGSEEPGRTFPDLYGRWEVLRGHLALGDYLYRRDGNALGKALEHYKVGFPAIAGQSAASSGSALIPDRFENFGRLFRDLPADVQADWQTKLMAAWQRPDEGSTLLIAALQELLARPLREED